MKKLNRKGFTLIELLAVIVILAIVLVVTIPSVLRSVAGARDQSLQNAANSVADWMTRQDELKELQGTGVTTDTVDTNFNNLNITSTASGLGDKADDILKAAGLGGGTSDVTATVWRSGNRICVELTPVDNGRFDGVEGTKKSSGCE